MRHGKRAPSRGPSFDPDEPVAGFYRLKLRKGATDSALRIWHGFPMDPETGAEMHERPMVWQATLNGGPCDYLQFWPACARDPISEAEHNRLVERNKTMEPESPFYDPLRKVDINSAPPPF
jgi:hypothetical protein